MKTKPFRSACMALAVLATSHAACFDGSVDVIFDVPKTEPITEIRFAVYAEAQTPLLCDDLAYGDIDIDVLESTRVLERLVEPGSSIDLDGIPRRGRKLFFAEALTESGASIYAGCAEVGEIDGPTEVVIPAERRKNSVLIGRVFNSPSNNALGEVRIAVFDLTGELISGEAVRFTVLGAGGPGAPTFREDGTAVTTTAVILDQPLEGIASFTPQTPPAAGPIRIDTRIRWSQSPALPLTGFLSPAVQMQTVPGDLNIRSVSRGSDIVEVGGVGPQGAPRIVLLSKEPIERGGAATLHQFDMTASGTLQAVGATPVGVDVTGEFRGALTLGKLSVAGVDKIIAVWSNVAGALRWTEVRGGQTNTIMANFSSLPVKLRGLSVCQSPTERVLFAQLRENGDIEAANTDGSINMVRKINLSALNLEPETALIELGCVRDTLNQFRTTFVFDQDAGGSLSFSPSLVTGDYSGEDPVYRAGEMSVATNAVWIGPFEEGASGTMLLSQLTNNGPITARYQIQPLNDSIVNADLQSTDSTPTVAQAVAEGDVNGDGEGDVVSLLFGGTDDQGPLFFIHVSMSAEEGERLRATLPSPLRISGGRLRLVDLDGDGTDEIVVGAPASVHLVRMGLL